MAATETIVRELEARESRSDRVFSRRHATLLATGYDPRHALRLALAPAVDLELAIRLQQDGCPPDLAERILL